MKNHTHTPHYCCGVPVTDSCPVCGATGLTAARFSSESETAEIKADKEFCERLEHSAIRAPEAAEDAEKAPEPSGKEESSATAKRSKKKA